MSREAAAVAAMLDRAALPSNAVLVVQSAFRNLGRQDYRVESFIEALLERLGPRATLLMPVISDGKKNMFISGSISASSREFFARKYRARKFGM